MYLKRFNNCNYKEWEKKSEIVCMSHNLQLNSFTNPCRHFGNYNLNLAENGFKISSKPGKYRAQETES